MKVKINDEIYNVEIVKKRTTKNTYLRVKDDLTILITCNTWTTNKQIEDIIVNNKQSIIKMLNKNTKKIESSNKFFYLGREYDIVYTSSPNITLGEQKVFINKNVNIDKWFKKEAQTLYEARLDYWYNRFSKKIDYPSLTIRKMKSRWGVCNTKEKRVTLNLELMRKPIECLDYVIVHELSHLIEANHSSSFWKIVEENYPNYKNIRRILKD